MKVVWMPARFLGHCSLWGTVAIALTGGLSPRLASSQTASLTLSSGFTPNPTVLEGQGGGDRRAAEVVNTATSSTGPCLGYISTAPHQEVTLANNFSNLEMRVASDLDTTLVISGPGGVWCNDDSGSKNPAIRGAWLPGQYQVWVGAYTAGETPDYELIIQDRS